MISLLSFLDGPAIRDIRSWEPGGPGSGSMGMGLFDMEGIDIPYVMTVIMTIGSLC